LGLEDQRTRGPEDLDSGEKVTAFVLRPEPLSTLGAPGVSPEIARHAGWIRVRRLQLKAAHQTVRKETKLNNKG